MFRATISFLLSTMMIFSQFLGLSKIEAIENESPSPQVQKISIASDRNTILYGESSIVYNDVEYTTNKNGIAVNNGTNSYSTKEKSASSDNFNVSKDKLYYTVFENGTSSIRSMDIKSGKINTLLSCGTEEIRNMYVVDDSYFLYLTGGIVYKSIIGTGKADRVSPIDNIYSFAPTSVGNLYASGKVNEASLFLDEVELITDMDYYTFNGDFLAFANGGVTYQISFEKLGEFVSSVRSGKCHDEFTFLSVADEFNMYGDITVNELLNETDFCAECASVECDEIPENGEQNDPANFADAPDDLCSSDSLTISSLNSKQQAIYDRAEAVVTTTWTCLETFHRWYNSDLTTTVSPAYVEGHVYVGLPYSRPGRYNAYQQETGTSNYWQVYIGLEGFNGSTQIATLADFNTRVAQSTDPFWQAARDPDCTYFGPLYGQDCGRFVSYAWNASQMSTSGIASSALCYRISNFGSSDISLQDLACLLPGDALVSAVGERRHAILVTNVAKNSSGAITAIEIMEETPPLAVRTTYYASPSGSDKSISDFLTRLNDSRYNYQIYRLKDTATLNPNKGSVPDPKIDVVTGKAYGTLCTNGQLPVPTRTGYSFAGWYTKRTGGTKVTASTIVTETSNHTLYAHWTAKTYTVTFNSNGGTVAIPKSMTVTFGSAYGSLPTVTKAGYYFSGWNTSADGSGTAVNSSTIVSIASNHTLYACWILENPASNIVDLESISNKFMEEKLK